MGGAAKYGDPSALAQDDASFERSVGNGYEWGLAERVKINEENVPCVIP
jgi:hypothetical protein